jgi:hypothetical protein
MFCISPIRDANPPKAINTHDRAEIKVECRLLFLLFSSAIEFSFFTKAQLNVGLENPSLLY